MKRRRLYLIIGAVARCIAPKCGWTHVVSGAPDVTTKQMTVFNVTANGHARRHEHDVAVRIDRVFPGRRLK